MAKETQILSRLAANHLHLAQFEPLRAILLALRTRNRDLARSILQTIVAHSGRFQNVLWSPSCSSPALLTHLATIELLQFDNASSAWNFDPEALRLRAEFLLLVQNLIDLLSESKRKNIDLSSIGKKKDILNGTGSLEDQPGTLDTGEELRDGNGEPGSCMRILEGILELGVKRLKADVDGEMHGSEIRVTASVAPIEGELRCLRRAILDHADIFDALCENVHRQIRQWECYDPGLAITVREGEDAQEELLEEEDVRVLGLIQRTVQLAHLDAMKQSVKEGNAEEAVSHIRFLHFDYGVEESEYRYIHFYSLAYVVFILHIFV